MALHFQNVSVRYFLSVLIMMIQSLLVWGAILSKWSNKNKNIPDPAGRTGCANHTTCSQRRWRSGYLLDHYGFQSPFWCNGSYFLTTVGKQQHVGKQKALSVLFVHMNTLFSLFVSKNRAETQRKMLQRDQKFITVDWHLPVRFIVNVYIFDDGCSCQTVVGGW